MKSLQRQVGHSLAFARWSTISSIARSSSLLMPIACSVRTKDPILAGSIAPISPRHSLASTRIGKEWPELSPHMPVLERSDGRNLAEKKARQDNEVDHNITHKKEDQFCHFLEVSLRRLPSKALNECLL